MSQLRVFLSHSSQDKGAADQFARTFRQAGADVWYDEENLGAGHLRRAIMKELGERPIFIVLLSPAALASSWVLDECEWAYDLQRDEPSRVMLPVVVEPLERTDLNVALYLRSLKRVEAGDLRPLPIADAATQALRLLGMAPAGQSFALFAPQLTESAGDLVLRGKGLTAQKQYGEAVRLFERATQLEPDNWDAWFNLGYAQGEAGQWQEALAAYERALTLQPNDSATWTNKAGGLLKLGLYQEALMAAGRATTEQPDLAAAWFNKGVALRGLKRYEEALVSDEQALILDPEFADAWNDKGYTLYLLGRFSEALEAAEQALALDAHNALALSTAGEALYGLGRLEEALTSINRSLEIASENAEAWRDKAAVLRGLGREAEAQEAEQQANRLPGL